MTLTQNDFCKAVYNEDFEMMKDFLKTMNRDEKIKAWNVIEYGMSMASILLTSRHNASSETLIAFLDSDVIFPECVLDDDLMKKIEYHMGWNDDHQLIKKLISWIPVERWIGMRDMIGTTILHSVVYSSASKNQIIEIWNMFWKMPGMSKIANVSSKYETIVPHIIRFAYPELLEHLIEIGMDICAFAVRGPDNYETPYHVMLRKFAESKSEEKWKDVRRIFELVKVYWNAKDRIGNTVTSVAHYYGWSEVLKGLIPPWKEFIKDKSLKVERTENGFEKSHDFYNFETNARYALEYTENDKIIFELLEKLRNYRYCKDISIIKTLTQEIVTIFSKMENSFLKRCDQRLCNETMMYGFLYLEPVKFLIKY